MKYRFTKFNGIYPRGDTKIGLNASGLIRLSSGFCRNTNVTNFKYSILFYDRQNKAMAFKFVIKSEDGVLRITKDGTGATISSLSFFRANNISIKNYSGRYEWKKMFIPDIGEVYIIELRKNEKSF